MTTYKRICIKDYEKVDSEGNKLSLKRGQEYLTSKEEDKTVVVFTNFWVKVPLNIFGGELLFTK
jgi:hypothetical protein